MVIGWMFFCLAIGQIAIPYIAKWLNNVSLTEGLIKSTMISFNILWFAYLFFALICVLNSYFYRTGRPKSLFVVSFAINIGIYIPLGLMYKSELIDLSYINVLLITVVIYIINALMIYLLYKKDFKLIQYDKS